MSTFSENLKKIRKSKNLTMEEFGQMFDPPASKGVVSNWENNYNFPNNERLEFIATLGGMTVDELLGGVKITKKGKTDIEMWKRILENHTKMLDSLERLKNSNYHDKLMNITTKLENDLSKIIDDIDAGKLNLEGVKIKLDTLQTGLSEVSYNTYDDMKVLDANIASNKNTIDLANRKLEELGYTSASNDKTDAE